MAYNFNPEINWDYVKQNEGIILKSLKESNDGKTIVIVSHRSSTMNIADSILNVEKTSLQGKVRAS